MPFTRLYNSMTADADEVHNNFVFVRAGSMLPLAEPTSGVLTPTTSVYDLGSNAYKYKDGYFSGNVNVSNNLIVTGTTDITGNVTITGTLTADSGIKTDTTCLKTKVVEIGDWDMDTSITINLGTVVPDEKKIRSVSVIIRNDGGQVNNLEKNDSTGHGQGYFTIGSPGSISLHRLNGGIFDSISFNATSFNRGWVTITYEA